MGFPAWYTELLLPKLFFSAHSLLGFIRHLITTLFSIFGLQHYIQPNNSTWHDYYDDDFPPHHHHPTLISESASVSALLIRELLPVVKFSDNLNPPESCAVCLYEFEGHDDVRRLNNCRHIFHKGCVDRWLGYDQKTCPLCRTPFVTEDMQGAFNERLWEASGIPDFYGDFPHSIGYDL